jgi:3-oxoacyl-[acyl-carrier-protein] synthase III
MGTIIEQVSVAHGGWRSRHSALHLAVTAAKQCLEQAACPPNDLDLLVNAGIYRDKNLGEPALAALIQEDIGANPEDPYPDAHGTFSFDISNGTCGVLTGLQIVDGFLQSGAVARAMIVASDADPGAGMSKDFPFSAAGAAMLCRWADDDFGLGEFHWANFPDGGETFSATVGLDHGRNILHIDTAAAADQQFAAAAAKVANECLQQAGLEMWAVDLIVSAPAHPEFRAALAGHLGVPEIRIAAARDHRVHTAALGIGLHEHMGNTSSGRTVLFVTAGAGITAGAVLYREPR